MVTPASISKYLADIRLPATRDELVDWAELHDAPDYVVGALASLPDEVYESLAEVWAIVGNMA
jgi:hypothetical protein